LPQTSVLDLEVEREGVSYTVQTLEWLLQHSEIFAHAERFLLCGADAALSFHQWKDSEKIMTIVKPLVGVRRLSDASDTGSSLLLAGETEIGLLDISSTMIRDRLWSHQYVDHLLSEEVLSYIRKKVLYSEGF